jgi:hypothetical protein
VIKIIGWIVLALMFAAATMLLGWWTVPVVGGAWGLLVNRRGAWRAAAGAAAIAWAVLLAVFVAGGLGTLISQLGGSLRLPGLVVAVLTLILPAVLAGSAAELGAVLRMAIAASGRSVETEG